MGLIEKIGIPIGLLLISMTTFASAASASSFYTFNLVGPNTANSGTGTNTLTLTGSGSFTTTGITPISCQGTFEITSPSGLVLDAGTLVCTSFDSFTAYQPGSGGTLGGQLTADVTLVSLTGATTSGDLTVTCKINNPSATEGITFVSATESFTNSVIGATLFHNGT